MAARNKLPPRVLWVEGKDDSAVVQSLCRQHDVPEVFRVDPREGDANLIEGLPLEIRRSGLECFGIVVDADSDAGARWNSVRHVLLTEGYPAVPETMATDGIVVSAPELPRFGAWIMPDNAAPGMLENFAAALVPDGDALWSHAAEAIDRIPEEVRRFPETRKAKAHIHTWLAWQESPGSPMGQAITKRYLDANAPIAQAFVSWLRKLMV